ncbi:MAG: SLBB domain-containing protein [Planctomycetes bacterium]|nr:SLBB domain-containing protein [Planctomycetota bacterium]
MAKDRSARPLARVVTLPFALIVCALATACASSVRTVNERLALVRPDASPSRSVIDPAAWIRPRPTEYRIGARDVLEIEIHELEKPNESKRVVTRVAEGGTVVLPLIGVVQAVGLTAPELQRELESRYGVDFLVEPNISVLVAEHNARSVTVLGAVKEPGSMKLEANATTLVDVLALAGGVTEDAGSTVFVVRGNPRAAETATIAAQTAVTMHQACTDEDDTRVVQLELSDLVERGDLASNCVLEDGDVVHVPQAAKVFVTGHVREGGGFPLRGDLTILRALALAGGLDDHATPSETVLIRRTTDGRQAIPIDLDLIAAGEASDVLLRPDDVVVVNENATSRTIRDIGSFFAGVFTIGWGL